MSQVRSRLDAALQGRYRIERPLGEGGMATVFLARDLRHDRPVALKVLRPDVGLAIGSERFLREVRIAATLSHPHILPLFDSGEADGLLYFVMPFARGESLRDRLARDGSVPVAEAVRIVRQVAGALASAHEAGIVHRDVKPANILLEAGEALITDFGIARAVDAAAGGTLTTTGRVLGTPAYMSPEQISGDGHVSGASDQYSLGCVAYEIVTGQPPFGAGSTEAVIAGHLARRVPTMRRHGATVPPSVEAVVRRALEKKPQDRFPGVDRFAEALERADSEVGRQAFARHRRLRRAAGALLVALAGVGLWSGFQRLAGGTRVERIAVLPATNLTGDSAQGYFVAGVHSAIVSELQRAGVPAVARQSVLQYRGTDKPVAEIARELNVDALLEPAVSVREDSVSVEVALIDGRSQLPLWTARYDGAVAALASLYRELSGALAGELGIVLSAEAVERLQERPTLDPLAQRDYLRGLDHVGRFTPLDFERAREYFESALEREPRYAEAYVGLRSVWAYQAQGGLVPPAEARERTRELIDRALEIDPDLPEALSARAQATVWQDWDLEAAPDVFRRALVADSLNARMRAFNGHLLTILGRWDEADTEMVRALALDPLDPFIQGLRGAQLMMVGRSAEALDVLRRMYEETPSAGFGGVWYALALHEVGRHDDEVAFQRRIQEMRRRPHLADVLDEGYRAGGHPEAARRLARGLIAMRAEQHVGGLDIAVQLLTAGEPDAAVDWLRVDVEEHGQNVPYYGVLPWLWPLHDHPGFRTLLNELGLTPHKPPDP